MDSIDKWKNFNWLNSISELSNGLISSEKNASLRALAQGTAAINSIETKNVRKSLEKELWDSIKPLISKYQKEIDEYNSSFKICINFVKRCDSLPDPVPFLIKLQSSLQEVEELKAENGRLEQMGSSAAQVQELTKEVESLKAELLKDKEDYKKEIERNTLIYKESMNGLERSLEITRKELTDLKLINNNLTEKFVNRDANDDDGARLKLESLLDSLDKSEQKALELRIERDNLAQRIKDISSSDSADMALKEANYMIDQLKAKLEESEQVLDQSKSRLKEKTNEYEKLRHQDKSLLDNFARELEEALKELDKQKDYDEIKKQLSVIKKIELDDIDGPEGLSIEQLLSQKNKRLQGQLMEIKQLNKEQDDLIFGLKESLSQSEGRVKTLSSLVASLEADVVKLNQVLDSKPAMSPKINDLEALLSSSSPVSNFQTSNKTDIVPILTSQRDRFRARNEELEEKNRHLLMQIQGLENRLSSVAVDNTKLYEKMRYMESFNDSRWRRNSFDYIGLIEDNDSDDLMNRYRTAYETSLDPFKNFSKEEANKRIKSMNPAERLVLIITQLIVSNRIARWIFVGYLTSLHLLVFSSMYFLALNGDDSTTVNIQEKI